MIERFIDYLPLAQAAPAGAKKGAGDPTMTIIMMVGMVAIFYFMIIMPQRKQQKARSTMLDALKVGDKILTTGGIYGLITKMDKGGGSIRVRVAQGVEFRMARSAIASKTSKDDKEEEE